MILNNLNRQPFHSTAVAANGVLYVTTMERLYTVHIDN